jgi:protein-L-isoaspartate(D-aspartate) O-methyltransferase
MDFAAARQYLLDGQIRVNGVTDPRILAAMASLPRENFVPPESAKLAYLDFELPVGGPGTRRRMLRPMVLAKLVQAAEIESTDRVLDVGCLTGYSTALIAHLAESVIGLEQDAALARQAQGCLAALGLANASVAVGPLAEGLAEQGPYDVIVVNGACEVAPAGLFRQLKDGGRLVTVVGAGPADKAMRYRCIDGDVSGVPIFDAAAPVLEGFAAQPAFVF